MGDRVRARNRWCIRAAAPCVMLVGIVMLLHCGDEAFTSTSGDASTGGEAGGDSSTSGDASSDATATFSCANVDATLCDDFDTTALGALWGGSYARQGSLTLSTVALSPPHSLQSKVLAPDAAPDAAFASLPQADLYSTFVVVPTNADLELDFSLAQAVAETTAFAAYSIATIQADTGKGGVALTIHTGPSGGNPTATPHFYLDVSGVASNGYDLGPIPATVGDWTHVKIHVDFSTGDAGAARVDLNGTLTLQKENINTLAPGVTSVTVIAGATTFYDPGGMELRIDNFVFNLR